MLNLRAMLEAATSASLVLVDEIGTGTAPEEGAALAVALLEEFRAHRCLTLATTHHDRLKTYAATTPGILNAAVEFDDANLRPTYRLLVGVPGVSSGIAIAERLGLPAPLVERARAELSPQVREAAGLIAWLHRSRDELEAIKRAATGQLAQLEEERRKLRTEWVERQRARLAGLEKQFAELAKQYERQIAQLVGEIKDRELRAQMEKQAGRRLQKLRAEAREEANAAAVQHLAESQQDLGLATVPAEEAVTPEQLVAGARVRVRGLREPVVVRQLDGRSAEVQAGPLRMKVAVADITGLVQEGRGEVHSPAAGTPRVGPGLAPPKSSVTVHAQQDAEVPADEINVIGCTVEEATTRVDKFLDKAALAGKPRVRIIHGHGTGALRRGLAAFLWSHPLVEHLSAEEADRGGTAITVVQLRS
jgi:DNA mismatch repair protein MutS2